MKNSGLLFLLALILSSCGSSSSPNYKPKLENKDFSSSDPKKGKSKNFNDFPTFLNHFISAIYEQEQHQDSAKTLEIIKEFQFEKYGIVHYYKQGGYAASLTLTPNELVDSADIFGMKQPPNFKKTLNSSTFIEEDPGSFCPEGSNFPDGVYIQSIDEFRTLPSQDLDGDGIGEKNEVFWFQDYLFKERKVVHIQFLGERKTFYFGEADKNWFLIIIDNEINDCSI
jgi:hypothetical protein